MFCCRCLLGCQDLAVGDQFGIPKNPHGPSSPSRALRPPPEPRTPHWPRAHSSSNTKPRARQGIAPTPEEAGRIRTSAGSDRVPTRRWLEGRARFPVWVLHGRLKGAASCRPLIMEGTLLPTPRLTSGENHVVFQELDLSGIISGSFFSKHPLLQKKEDCILYFILLHCTAQYCIAF